MELNGEQIIKALEICGRLGEYMHNCVGCPLKNEEYCVALLSQDALALIRDITAENERLEREVDRLSQVVLYHDGITEMKVAEANADTVRKMQERLKACTECVGESTVDNPLAETYSVVREDTIDQIAREMMEESND